MAKRRRYKRDKRGRFAPTGNNCVKRAGGQQDQPASAVRGSLGKTVRLGRVGPGGEYAGIHVGAQLRSPSDARITTSGCRRAAGSLLPNG